MGKIEKLLDKTKRNSETKKWKMYVFAVIGILVVVGMAVGIFSALCRAIDMDGYISDKQVVRTYDFYDLKIGETENAVFLLGDSGIDCMVPSVINQYLATNGCNYSVYSIAQGGIVPQMYALQTQNIIDAKPAAVLMILSYRHLGDVPGGNYWIDERTYLVHDRLKVDSELLQIYNDKQKQDILSEPSWNYYKKFIKGALENKLKGVTYSNPEAGAKSRITGSHTVPNEASFLKSYYSGVAKKTQEELESDILSNPYWKSYYAEITTETTQNKEAAMYVINKFKENGIKIILLSPCLNPMLSAEVSDSSRQNHHDFLNATNIAWYNMEFTMEKEYFLDLYHLSAEGAWKFAPKVADIILKELT